MTRKLLFAVFFLILLPQSTKAEAVSPAIEIKVEELIKAVNDLKQVVEIQQKEIEILKNGSAQISKPQPVSSLSATAGKWNPDIGVIADTLFRHDSSKSDEKGADRVSVRELELILGSYVDPYSRMDVNIAFSDFEEAHIQEAYLTRFGLPFESAARIGRFKPKFGKVLAYHRDILDTADEPLAVQRYFGDESMNKTGVDFTKAFSSPISSAHELIFGVIEGGTGEGGTVFGDTRRRPTGYSHLRNFWDLTDLTNYEFGISHMIGSSDDDAGFETNVIGLDSTLIHFPGAPDQRVKWQTELFFVNQGENIVNESAVGAYSLLDYRFHKRWAAGFRFDSAELLTDTHTDIGYGGYLTFYQTDFARWRLQFNHIDMANGDKDNQVFVQGIFAIGDHKHKIV